jgi:hypothetical protein
MIGMPAVFGIGWAGAEPGDNAIAAAVSAAIARDAGLQPLRLIRIADTFISSELVDSAQPIEAAPAGQITPKSLQVILVDMRRGQQKPSEYGKTGAGRMMQQAQPLHA